MIRAKRRIGLGITAVVLATAVVSSSAWLAGTSASALAGVKGGFGWGNNQTGEVDDGTTVMRKAPVPSVGLAGITSMSAGLWHCLAIRSNGTVISWGHNAAGELGNGTTKDSSTPVGVAGLTHVTHVASGGAFSLALRSNGEVLAWGHNASGELGDGKLGVDSSTPVRVKGLGAGSGIVAISAGNAFALALKSNGAVLSWGNNQSGELGNGTTTDSDKPVQVKGLGPGSGVVAISAGTAFSLALKSDGTALAWGNNQSGEVGNGKAPSDAEVPAHVKGLGSGSAVVAISAGGAFALALRSDGTVMAWGDNASGQLGNGKTKASQRPIQVSGIKGVRQVSAGYTHALALSHGNVYAWGDNALGQIGDGKRTNATEPVRIGGFGRREVLGVYAGGNHSHALVGPSLPKPTSSTTPSRGPSAKPSSRPSAGPSSEPSAKPSPKSSSKHSPKPAVSPSETAPDGPTPAVTDRAAASSDPSNSGGPPAAAAAAILGVAGLLVAVPLMKRRRSR